MLFFTALSLTPTLRCILFSSKSHCFLLAMQFLFFCFSVTLGTLLTKLSSFSLPATSHNYTSQCTSPHRCIRIGYSSALEPEFAVSSGHWDQPFTFPGKPAQKWKELLCSGENILAAFPSPLTFWKFSPFSTPQDCFCFFSDEPPWLTVPVFSSRTFIACAWAHKAVSFQSGFFPEVVGVRVIFAPAFPFIFQWRVVFPFRVLISPSVSAVLFAFFSLLFLTRIITARDKR